MDGQHEDLARRRSRILRRAISNGDPAAIDTHIGGEGRGAQSAGRYFLAATDGFFAETGVGAQYG